MRSPGRATALECALLLSSPLGRRLAAGALWLAALLPLHAVAADAPVYRFSPVNQYGIQMTAAYWNPIIGYVSEKSGVKLELRIGRTSADTTAYVLAQEVEFIFSNHFFSPEREKLGWKVVARRAAPPVRGQLVVPADSPVKRVADLAGKPVAFPGPEATISYKMPYAHLVENRVDIDVVFGGNTDGAIAQLFSGKVAAAGVNSQLIEGYAKREARKYRVLWSTEPLHDLPLMVSGKVPERDQQAVARAFAGMKDDPRGREVLERAAQLVGMAAPVSFVLSDGREYEPYRRFYRTTPASLH